MDLLIVLMHEMGHLLRLDHDAAGVMAETLATGTRLSPPLSTATDTAAPRLANPAAHPALDCALAEGTEPRLDLADLASALDAGHGRRGGGKP